ncbi:MAG: gliding motility-associated C-terminal domain-containing protein [Bacteroidota bacterium]
MKSWIDFLFYPIISLTCFLIATEGAFGQYTIEVTVLSGGSTTTCTDGIFNAPGEPMWGVAIEDEPVQFYDNTCDNLIPYPNTDYIHFTRVVDCLSDLNEGELFVCLWTFDNDLGAFNKCNLTQDKANKGCPEVPCGSFGLPLPGRDSIYNFDPTEPNLSSNGFLHFRIAVSEDASDRPNLTNDDLCNAIPIPVVTSSNNIAQYTNVCATSKNDPPTTAGMNITNSVWFSFSPTDSRSVFINIDSDQDDPIQPEMTVFVAPTNNCSDNLVEVPSQRRPGGVNSVFYTLDCLNPKSTYYIMVDGTDADPTGIFSIVAAEGPYPASVPIDTVICRGDVYQIGNSSYANSGTYIDTVITNDDCVAIFASNLRVVEGVQLRLDVGDLARGEGQTGGVMVASAQFGTGSYEYNWSNGATNVVANNLIGGEEYCVTVTDRNVGCPVDTCFIMPFPIPTEAVIISDTVNCSTDQIGQLQMAITAGRPPYQYQVRGIEDPTFIAIGVIAKNDTLITIDSIPLGNYNVSTVDGDNFGDNFTASVTAPAPIAISLVDEQDATCFQVCNGSLEVAASGGTGELNFNWNGDFGDTPNITELCAGDYTVTVTDANQCQDAMQFTIVEPIAPNIGFFNVNPVACFGEANGTATLTINEAVDNILWDNGATTETVNNLAAGIHTVTITSEVGCQYTDSVSIEQPAAPLSAAIEITEAIACGGDSNGVLTDATTGGNGNYQYIWSNGSTTDFIDNLSAGTYELIVRDEKNCFSDAIVTLAEPLPLTAEVSTQDVTCPAGENSGIISINNPTGGSAPYQYAVNNQNFISNTEITNLTAGTYAVLMQDDKGCQTIFDNLVINAPPNLSVDLGGNLAIKLGTIVKLDATVSGNVIYEWTSTDSLNCSDCPSVKVNPTNTAQYAVRVTEVASGCMAEDKITVTVSKARDLFVPNAFSPNGDGINDELLLLGGSDIKQVRSFEIYSREGARVFKRDDFTLAEGVFWDGSYNGQDLSTDVFIYFAEIEFIDGVTELFRGDFTLVR